MIMRKEGYEDHPDVLDSMKTIRTRVDRKAAESQAQSAMACLLWSFREATELECTCGGDGPEGGCIACKIYHRMKLGGDWEESK